ncbi:MAG TPA: hypothetical protein VFU21_11060, partial [Kofleriaceae bacterium]|nr:hypothetical protein [Kofleriaceae bacterium]
LANGRATWPWAWAAESVDGARFAELQAASRAVAAGAEPEPLRARLAAAVSEIGRRRARATLRRAWDRAARSFAPSPAREALAADIERLAGSYG